MIQPFIDPSRDRERQRGGSSAFWPGCGTNSPLGSLEGCGNEPRANLHSTFVLRSFLPLLEHAQYLSSHVCGAEALLLSNANLEAAALELIGEG